MVCPVCDQGPVDILPEELARCPNCNHIFQNPLEVRAVYDHAYIADRYDSYDTTPLISGMRLATLKGCGIATGDGKLLDVGYGNGAFVKMAMKAGYDAYGCDVHGADYGVREVKLDGTQRWDVVTFFDSLEHFTTLDVIKQLVQRTSTIVISIPVYPPDFPQNRHWKHYRPGEHLHYFSLGSLCRLFAGKRLCIRSDIEDVIRGKRPDGGVNVATLVFSN
jgi:hypothetical protein